MVKRFRLLRKTVYGMGFSLRPRLRDTGPAHAQNIDRPVHLDAPHVSSRFTFVCELTQADYWFTARRVAPVSSLSRDPRAEQPVWRSPRVGLIGSSGLESRSHSSHSFTEIGTWQSLPSMLWNVGGKPCLSPEDFAIDSLCLGTSLRIVSQPQSTKGSSPSSCVGGLPSCVLFGRGEPPRGSSLH